MSKPAEKSAPSQGLRRSFRAGGYSIIATVVVIAIAIFVNLMAERLPANYTKLDMTAEKLFEISDQTRKLLGSLEHDVHVYLITQPAQEDSFVRQLLELYSGLSGKIKLHDIDPVVYPNFAAQYTPDSVYNNSLVVECQGRAKFVAYTDIYLYEIDYTTYEYNQEWNGENALTSAIDYVVSDDLPVAYTLKGHGETALSDTVAKLLYDQNVLVSELELLTNASLPQDADTLIINAPTVDLSAQEADIILEFLQQGGKLMLLTDYTETPMPNLMGLMAQYGLSLVPGIVIEGSMSNCLRGVTYYLLPYLRHHDITAPQIDGDYRALMPVAQGINTDSSLRGSLTLSPLLVTSSEAFSKPDGYNMTSYEKAAGDLDGPFYLAVAAEETLGAATTRLVWLTTSTMLEDEANALVAGANHDLFINAIAWMNARENSISIHSKSLEIQMLVVPSSALTRLSILFIGIIPAVFLAGGIFVTIRRRRA